MTDKVEVYNGEPQTEQHRFAEKLVVVCIESLASCCASCMIQGWHENRAVLGM